MSIESVPSQTQVDEMFDEVLSPFLDEVYSISLPQECKKRRSLEFEQPWKRSKSNDALWADETSSNNSLSLAHEVSCEEHEEKLNLEEAFVTLKRFQAHVNRKNSDSPEVAQILLEHLQLVVAQIDNFMLNKK
jgi:tRNA nucleotidyltransferase/poly(A) polymerase